MIYSFVQPTYEALFARWGEQHWWPGRTRLEMMLGAILTQNTAWSNVEKAITTLRTELLSWKGIGQETADSILLYAAKRPVFVVDAYTMRFLSRHGWCDERASYDSIAKLFTDDLPEGIQLYNEYHALIVRLGKEHCKTKPKCAGCPLERFFD